MNFSPRSLDLIEMHTGQTLQALGIAVGVRVWKDLQPARGVIFPLPLEFPALERKHGTGQLAALERWEGEGMPGWPRFKKKKNHC